MPISLFIYIIYEKLWYGNKFCNRFYNTTIKIQTIMWSIHLSAHYGDHNIVLNMQVREFFAYSLIHVKYNVYIERKFSFSSNV